MIDGKHLILDHPKGMAKPNRLNKLRPPVILSGTESPRMRTFCVVEGPLLAHVSQRTHKGILYTNFAEKSFLNFLGARFVLSIGRRVYASTRRVLLPVLRLWMCDVFPADADRSHPQQKGCADHLPSKLFLG